MANNVGLTPIEEQSDAQHYFASDNTMCHYYIGPGQFAVRLCIMYSACDFHDVGVVRRGVSAADCATVCKYLLAAIDNKQLSFYDCVAEKFKFGPLEFAPDLNHRGGWN